MKLLKQRSTVLWRLLILMLLITSCGGSDDTAAPIELEPAELTLVTFQTTGPWANAMEATIEKFQETYPDVLVKQEGFRRWPQGYLTDTSPPNIMSMGANRFLREAILKQQLVDLTDVWVQSGLMETVSPAFQDLSAYDGKQYYLPVGYSWAAIYYNKGIFNRYGLTPPQTWDEFLMLCDTLLANGEVPLSIGLDSFSSSMLWFSYLNLRLNGAQFQRELISGQVRYDDPRVQDVLNTWLRLIDQDYFVENPINLSDLEMLAAIIRSDDGQLSRQKAVMALNFQSEVDELPAKFRAELDFFPFPVIDSAISPGEVVNGFGYMVPNGGQDVAQTLAFLSYMGSVEAQTHLLQHSAGAVAFVPANGQVEVNDLPANVQRGQGILSDADAYVTPFLFSTPNVMWSKMEFSLRRFFDQESTATDFMADMEEARQKAQEQGAFFNP